MQSYDTTKPPYQAPLVPSSESAGNTIADPIGHQLAMTGLGSDSVNPLPDRLDRLPMPVIPDEQYPVNALIGRVTGSQQPEGQPAQRPGQWSGVTLGSGTKTPGHGFGLTPSAEGG